MKTNKKIRALKNKCDKLWSEAVRMKGRCEYCGRTSDTNQLHPHHFIRRACKSTRWDIENGICLCASHHSRGSFSAHKSPTEFVEWAKKERGQEWYDKMILKSNEVFKVNLGNLEIVREELEIYIEKNS